MVQLWSEELIEVASIVDENMSQMRLTGLYIVSNQVMSEVIKHFKCNKETWLFNCSGPVKYGLVDDLKLQRVQAALREFSSQAAGILFHSQATRDFDDSVFCSSIDIRLVLLDEVQDVAHEGSVTTTHLVYNEIIVRIIPFELIVGQDIASQSFTIER